VTGIESVKAGDRFTQEFRVTQPVYQGFIQLFGDRNELHTDKVFAQSKGFDREVMHGNILNGFLSYFVGECLPLRNVIIHSQEIKYIKPVYVDHGLNFQAEITDVHDSVGVMVLKFQFLNESGVCVAKGKVQVGVL
jgi:acyl dehydratase